MRALRSLLLGLAAAVALSLAGVSPIAAGQIEACASDPSRLGVSRIVEVDTKVGPLFGHLQYRDLSFLEDGEVVLTFDDGPLRRYTRGVLQALADQCTKATFFMVGRMAVADPAMVREVAAQGHTVGSHTWSHRNLATLSASRAKGEIELGASAISKALGKPIAPFFRFPYLSDPKSMISYLQSREIGVFSIDVDSSDYKTKSAEPVVRRVLAQLADRKKGIILFHDIQASTAKAIATVLHELKKRGYKVVHIVPKSPLQTQAEYDTIADNELDRRKLAQAGSPLAERSVVWPNMPGSDEIAAGNGKVTATSGEALPWSQTTEPNPQAIAPEAKPHPAPQRRHRSAEDIPWQERMFENYH